MKATHEAARFFFVIFGIAGILGFFINTPELGTIGATSLFLFTFFFLLTPKEDTGKWNPSLGEFFFQSLEACIFILATMGTEKVLLPHAFPVLFDEGWGPSGTIFFMYCIGFFALLMATFLAASIAANFVEKIWKFYF